MIPSITFDYSKLFKELIQLEFYQKKINDLNVVSIGLEGLGYLIELKKVNPHLKVGYIYYQPIDNEFSDLHDSNVSEITFIPLITDIKKLTDRLYWIKSMDINLIHQTISLFSKQVLFIGSMTDPILMKLLEFYDFNQFNLILRRPHYFETSSLRSSINKYLKFSSLPQNIMVIDTIKVDRYLKKIEGQKISMVRLDREISALYIAAIFKFLKLPAITENLYRIKLNSCWFQLSTIE